MCQLLFFPNATFLIIDILHFYYGQIIPQGKNTQISKMDPDVTFRFSCTGDIHVVEEM